MIFHFSIYVSIFSEWSEHIWCRYVWFKFLHFDSFFFSPQIFSRHRYYISISGFRCSVSMKINIFLCDIQKVWYQSTDLRNWTERKFIIKDKKQTNKYDWSKTNKIWNAQNDILEIRREIFIWIFKFFALNILKNTSIPTMHLLIAAV